MRIRVRTIVLALLGACIAGCGSKDPVSYHSIQKHPTPELSSIADRPDDVSRHTAIARNQNLRMFWDDVTRMWMIDQPSQLSPYPITNTSGNPR